MPELVSPHTEAITGQLADSERESNSLTLGGLINLRIAVVALWKEGFREELGIGNRVERGLDLMEDEERWRVKTREGSKRKMEDVLGRKERRRKPGDNTPTRDCLC